VITSLFSLYIVGKRRAEMTLLEQVQARIAKCWTDHHPLLSYIPSYPELRLDYSLYTFTAVNLRQTIRLADDSLGLWIFRYLQSDPTGHAAARPTKLHSKIAHCNSQFFVGAGLLAVFISPNDLQPSAPARSFICVARRGIRRPA